MWGQSCSTEIMLASAIVPAGVVLVLVICTSAIVVARQQCRSYLARQ